MRQPVASALLATLALSACQRTEQITRSVNLHLTSCVIASNSVGEYVSTGDDEPTSTTSALLQLVGDQTIVGIPATVQSLALVAFQPDDATWQAVTLVPPTGNVDMLLLPSTQSCTLTTTVGMAGTVPTLGLVDSQTVIAFSTAAASSFRIDLTTGNTARMASGLRTPRSNAPLVPLGTTRAVVAGGTNDGNVLLTDAEVYDSSAQDFVATLELSEQRSNHGAVTLASGDVLLVGGVGSANVPLGSIERISATLLTSSTLPIALMVPRTNPTVLRLADGTILVGGGTDVNNDTISAVEFISADATTLLGGTTLVPARALAAFVALDGGGALYVAAPDDTTEVPEAWLIENLTATPLSIDPSTALGEVTLASRGGGGALLWNGMTWLTFDLWNTSQPFAMVPAAPMDGPGGSSSFVVPDPGLRVWSNADGSVHLWRDIVRNAFSTEGPYLVTDTNLMSPDSNMLSFDTIGGLTLGAGQSAFVSDARYLDVTVDVNVVTIAAPIVVLRTPTGDIEVGGSTCPFAPVTAPTTVHVERTGATVSFSVGGGALTPCTGATLDAATRVAVGVRGSNSGSTAIDLRVTRVPPLNEGP